VPAIRDERTENIAKVLFKEDEEEETAATQVQVRFKNGSY
jgi:hypothetical protein